MTVGQMCRESATFPVILTTSCMDDLRTAQNADHELSNCAAPFEAPPDKDRHGSRSCSLAALSSEKYKLPFLE